MIFRVVIVGWNVKAYIERCINSVIDQEYKDWTACIVLDPCDDGSYETACTIARKDHRIKVLRNNTQMFATANIIRSIKEQPCQDEDVIITLDGDDWFADYSTLSIIKGYYDRHPELLITHGSWLPYPNPELKTNNAPYTAEDWQKGIRKVNWRASHLRTFKYKVWKHLKHEDLIGPDGIYARVAWDLAIMFPMLEMAGQNRVKFVPEKIYVYNQESPYNDNKMRIKEQLQFAYYFIAKRPYQYIATL